MSEYMEFDWRSAMISRDISPSEILPKRLPESKEPKDKCATAQALRNLLHSSTHYEVKNNFQPQDDKTLLKFMYARKFNPIDAFTLLVDYYFYKRRNKEVFKNLSLETFDIRQCIEHGLPGVLNQRDRKGRCVLIINATNWDFSSSLISIYRSIWFTLEFLINDVQNQANGFLFIVDWTEFSFRQSTYLKPSVLKLMIEGLQDCFPAKFKGIHFINQPWYVEAALTCIKPFLKDKTRDRIHLHGNNLSTLHEHVAKDILPAEMGGEQACYNPQIWIDKITQSKFEIQ